MSKPFRQFSFLWALIHRYSQKYYFFFFILFSFLLGCFDLAAPFIAKVSLDRYILPEKLQHLTSLMYFVGAYALGNGFCQFVFSTFRFHHDLKVEKDFKVKVFQAILEGHRVSSFKKDMSWAYSVENDVSLVYQNFYHFLGVLVRQGLLLVGLNLVLWWVNWVFAILPWLGFLLFSALSVFFSKRFNVLQFRLREMNAKVLAFLKDTLSKITHLRVFNSSSLVLDKFVDYERERNLLRKRIYWFKRYENTINSAILIVIRFALSFWAIYLFMTGRISFGEVALVTLATMKLQGAALNFFASAREFMALEKIRSSLLGWFETEELEGPRSLESFSSLNAKGLSFAYEGGNWVLDDLSFTVKAGEKVAIVGGNGCGKTTLLRLLGGFLSSSKGTLSVNEGEELLLGGHFWGQLGGWMSQSEGLLLSFSGQEVSSVLGLKGANGGVKWPDFLKEEDLESLDFQALSEGERRKLELFRLKVMGRRVLFLDEPLIKLDDEGQVYFYEEILKDPDLTVFWATHHRDRMKDCDWVIDLEKREVQSNL